MCTLFEEIARESGKKGEAIGKAKGEAKGLIKVLKKYNESDENILRELISELGISEEIARGYLNQYYEGIL